MGLDRNILLDFGKLLRIVYTGHNYFLFQKKVEFKYIFKLLVLTFILLVFSSLVYSDITLDKQAYEINEVVTITLSQSTPKTQVIISSGTDNYKFLGIPDKKIIFIPKNSGTYQVNVKDPYSSTDQTIYFQVGNIPTLGESRQVIDGSSSLSSNIILDKQEYVINELVNIRIINLNPEKVIISNGVETYKFLGSIQENINFIPKKEGTYDIQLLDINDNVLDNINFNVITEKLVQNIFELDNNKYLNNPYQIKKPSREIKKTYLLPRIKNSKGIGQDHILKSQNKIFNSNSNNEILLDDWSEEFIVEPRNMKIKKINFKNVNLQKGFNLGLEELDLQEIGNNNQKVFYSYAIDPEQINFSYAKVTVQATGNELYKCAEWNFTQSICFGEWVKIKDISPGQNYDIYLTPKDPAYAETTKNADDCFDEDNNVACTGTQITAISTNGGGTYTPFQKGGGSPVRISFADTTDTQMDQIVECTIHIEGADSEGNTWALQLGNYSDNTWDAGSGQTISTTEQDHTWDCLSYFSALTNDYSAFNTFGVRITTNDAGKSATGYIDWAWVYINYSLKDTIAPSYSSILSNPSSPATYNPSGVYQFNTTWIDNEQMSIVTIEHNFTTTLSNYSMTGNLGSIYYYNYGTLAAGTYSWRTWANDTSGNTNNSMPYQTYTINKALPTLELKLNGVSNNISIERKSFAWINASLITPSTEIISTHINLTQINSGTTPLSNYTQFNDTGLFEIRVEYVGNENYTSGSLSYYLTVTDTTPPATVTNPEDTSNDTTWIFWTWTNPTDEDFNHTEIWINGTFYSNVSKPINYINVTDRLASTVYEIQIRTIDHYGNINTTWVTDLGETKTSADTIPPIISNVQNISITDSSVNVSFQTNENAKPKIYYGTQNGVYTQEVGDAIFDQFHWFIISGLKPSTTYYYLANAVDIAANEANSSEYSFTTLVDTTNPAWSNLLSNPSSPATYNPIGLYQFNTTWTDNGYLNFVWIEHNFDGFMDNYSITGNISSIFYYDYSSIAAGTYSWRTWANDTEGNIDASDWQTYTINKATASVNLLLNGTDGNFIINETGYANLTGVLVTGQGNLTLWIDTTLINNGSSPLTNITQFNIPGNYTIKAEYVATENYTLSLETHILIVNDIIAPNVTLTNPIPPHIDLDGDMILYFNVTDSGELTNCSIYVNDTLYNTKTIFTQGENTFTLNNFDNGFYLWNVTCLDSENNLGVSQTWNFTISINEYYPIIIPETCSDSDGTCTISNINVSDALYETHTSTWNKNNRYDYIYMNFTNPNIPLGSTIHWLNITYNKYQNTIDGNIFLEWYNTSNSQWIEMCAVAFGTASAPPTYDGINCEFNASGNSWPTVQDFNDGLQLRSVWYYSGGVAATVAHGTEFSGIYLKYTEDVTPPTVELVSPEDEDISGVGSVVFQYVPSDDNLNNCSLWGDFNGTWALNQTQTPTSEITNSFIVTLSTGYYDWNVQCFDARGNNAFASANWSVNITNPDLEILSNNIIFSNNSPREQQQITINATIKNIGNVNATQSFIVQFFDDDPDFGGTQIGLNQTINYLGFGKNTTLNVSWIVTSPGPQNIYVLVDVPLVNNGTIDETDETNNKAYNTLNVPSWTVTYGNITARVSLDTNKNKSFSDWNLFSPQGNIYAVETGSNINWNSLQALGRKDDNTTASNDFLEADTKIGMTGFVDSLYNTFTNLGVPKVTASFSSYYKTLNNISIRNSTINNNFITGILWDVGDGGTEYDGTQDIIFITKINPDNLGKYGNYDFEMNVPALLRNYSETTYNTIDYYTEIN